MASLSIIRNSASTVQGGIVVFGGEDDCANMVNARLRYPSN